ncbi:MAG TPA: hypothetical protein VN814_18995 [Caulobacteraceae bacterium]|nr:hypothetical protein [Caulobacteraceae bacterium]
MRRRHLLALLAAAVAAPQLALAADIKTVPIDKAFPFLAAYLGLPIAQRSRFYLAYRAMRDKHPALDARATIVAANGARTPVAFDHIGAVARLPSLAELKSAANVEMDSAPFQLGVELRCATPPSTRIDVAELVASLAQVNLAVSKVAGAFSLIIPKLTTAYFPDAAGAQALLGNGRAIVLPVYSAPIFGQVPYIEPGTLAGAKTVMLARAPSRIVLGGHPKTA